MGIIFGTVLIPSFFFNAALAIDLMQAYQMARHNDPAFQREIYRHQASPEIYNQARSELLPSLKFDASYQYTRQEILDTDVAVYGDSLANYNSTGYSLTLTQPIFKYSSYVRLKQAAAEVLRADLEFEAACQDMVLRLSETYIACLEAYDNLEFTRAEEEAVRLHFNLAQARYQSGLAPITDFHDARARLSNVSARRILAENSLDDALEALAAFTGEKITAFAKLKYTQIARVASGLQTEKAQDPRGGGLETLQRDLPLVIPDPDNASEWTRAALKQNVKILIQQQAVAVAKREINRQKGGHYPTLSAVGRFNRDNQGGSLYGGKSDLEVREALLQVEVPLFQGFSVASKTREARKQYEATRQDLEKERRAVQRETRAAFLGVKSAIENTYALRQSVVSSRIALEAKREGFQSGLLPSLAVLDAERDVRYAKQGYAKALYEYILNSLRLKKTVSNLNEAALGEINQWLEPSAENRRAAPP